MYRLRKFSDKARHALNEAGGILLGCGCPILIVLAALASLWIAAGACIGLGLRLVGAR